MTWTSIFTPDIWPIAAALCLLLLLAGYSWRRRSVPGALPFMIGCLFTLLVVVGLLMTELAVDTENRLAWQRFMNAWMLPAATAMTCFILEYAWPNRWLTKRNLVLLSIMPSLGAIYLLTNQLLQLVSPSFQGVHFFGESIGPVGRFLFAYSLILSVIDLTVFTWLFLHSPQHRWPVFLMVTGQAISRILLVVSFSKADGSLPPVLSFVVPFILFAIVFFRFRIFDPIPLARQTVIDQLHAGMIILDPQGGVVSLNPAAQKILGVATREGKGRLVWEWLPVFPETAQPFPDDFETEVSLGEEAALRYFALSSSRINDFRGLKVGSLLMLRDITEQKQAQAQILEQQRTLATQTERERMARELHDSLGQVLGYASFQVGSAAKLSRDGQGATSADQLDRLGEVIRDAHADLREHILNLRSTAALTEPFFPVVRQYLESYSNNYEIQIHLEVDPALSEYSFGPELQLQLFRILQEALSNARKHGAARHVEITFARTGGCLRLSIQDDGCGFDAQQVENRKEPHYGLQFMCERAGQLNGSLQVLSAPGSGTRVLLDLPYKE